MNYSKESGNPPIYIVTGGNGFAGNNIVQSLLIQYPNNNIPVIVIPNIRNKNQVFNAVMRAKTDSGLIIHTLVNPELRRKIIDLCNESGIKNIDFVGDLANYLDEQLDIKPLRHPGLYRKINQAYFNRIEAIEFTLSHDDGMSPERLNQAEIILTGVSRVGKTPLSVYLAMFGWKVANVPLIKGINPPDELFKVDPSRVFGLHINTSQLVAHRKKRMEPWGGYENKLYLDEKSVVEEIRHAMLIFNRGKFTVLNVSNKPIESTANEILILISKRFQNDDRKLESPYHKKPE